MSDVGTKTDPLSGATRAAKRNLLAASLVTIVVAAFDVSIDKIPVGGLQMSFDRGTFNFLLLLVLVYFWVQFCVYYYVDVRNFKPLQHQAATEEWRRQRVIGSASTFVERHRKWLKKQTRTHFITAEPSAKLQEYLTGITEGNPCAIRLWRNMRNDRHAFVALMWQLHSFSIPDDGLIEAFELDKDKVRAEERRLLGQAQTHLYRYPLYYFFSQAFAAPRLFTVRGMYSFRVYGLDGMLPAGTAILALLSMYNVIDLHWLSSIAPR